MRRFALVSLFGLVAISTASAQDQGVPCPGMCPIDADESCLCDDEGRVVTYLAREALRVVRFSFTYDALGNRLTKEWDRDDDGSVERRLSWQYDGDGRLLGWRDDLGADGQIDEWLVWTYDDLGNLTAEERGVGPEGSWMMRTSWVYDAEGNRISRNTEDDGGVVEQCEFLPPCPPPYGADCDCRESN